MDSTKKACIFCNLPKEQILYENDRLCIVKDKFPDAKHHYLVIPKAHYGTINTLGKRDKELVEEMINVGKNFMAKIHSNVPLLGFHVPPYNTIEHLHMHCVSGSWNSFLGGTLSFWTYAPWFMEASKLVLNLQKKQSHL